MTKRPVIATAFEPLEAQVNEYLIKHGTAGVSQAAIVKQFRRIANAAELVIHLNQLRDERKADKYTAKVNAGPPTTWWRATTRILEDD